MNNKTVFGSREAVSLMVIILLTKFVFTTPLLLINQSGVSAWISVIVSAMFAFFFFQLCICILKKKDKEIDFSVYQNKSFLIAGLLGGCYFYVLTASFIGQYIIGAMHSALPESPFLYVSLFCLVCILSIGFLGLEPCVRSARFFVVLLLMMIALLLVAFFEMFDLRSFAPFFGKGYLSTIIMTPITTWIFPEYFFLFYFLPFIKKKKYMLHTNFMTVLIITVCFLAVLGIYLLVVPSELAQRLNFPTHQIIYFIEGTVSQSLKPLYTFIWHISVFLYAGVEVVFLSEMLSVILKIDSRKPLVPILSVGLIFLSFVLGNESTLQQVMAKLLKYGIVLFPIIPFCLSVISRLGGNQCIKKQ